MIDRYLDRGTMKDVYWFGLTADGKNAFEYSTFEDFLFAKVFDGKSIFDIRDEVNIKEIDGCDHQERLDYYIGENK